MEKYLFLDHPADIKVRAFGRDQADLFINALLAMMEFIYGKKDDARECEKLAKTFTIAISADDVCSLLIDWLDELLYLSLKHHCLFYRVNFQKITTKEITAMAVACPAIAKDDIKAVTYNELKIKQEEKRWVAEVVFDI